MEKQEYYQAEKIKNQIDTLRNQVAQQNIIDRVYGDSQMAKRNEVAKDTLVFKKAPSTMRLGS